MTSALITFWNFCRGVFDHFHHLISPSPPCSHHVDETSFQFRSLGIHGAQQKSTSEVLSTEVTADEFDDVSRNINDISKGDSRNNISRTLVHSVRQQTSSSITPGGSQHAELGALKNTPERIVAGRIHTDRVALPVGETSNVAGETLAAVPVATSTSTFGGNQPVRSSTVQRDCPAEAVRRLLPYDDDDETIIQQRNSPLIAVTVAMRSGLQLQHHFNASQTTLQTIANWGRSSRAIATDDTEEFIILHPPVVRFTPSNLKRTLEELKLPKSVHLSVLRKIKSPNDGHMLSSALQSTKAELGLGGIVSPGTPV
jgi:hypothetical protein